MIFRFCSGSVTPASRVEEQVGGVHEVERQLQLLAEALAGSGWPRRGAAARCRRRCRSADRRSRGGSASRRRSNRRRPTGRRRPCRCPTCVRMRSVASSMNDAIVQSPVQPQTSKAKLPQDLGAVLGVHDLGMEQQRVERAGRAPPSRRSAPWRSSPRPETRAAPPPRRRRGSPRRAARRARPRRAAARGPPLPATRTSAWPNSRCPDRRTSPPSMSVISCMP